MAEYTQMLRKIHPFAENVYLLYQESSFYSRDFEEHVVSSIVRSFSCIMFGQTVQSCGGRKVDVIYDSRKQLCFAIETHILSLQPWGACVNPLMFHFFALVFIIKHFCETKHTVSHGTSIITFLFSTGHSKIMTGPKQANHPSGQKTILST